MIEMALGILLGAAAVLPAVWMVITAGHRREREQLRGRVVYRVGEIVEGRGGDV